MAMSPSYSHLVLTALLMGIAAPDTVGAGSRPPGGSQRADPTQSDTIDTIVRSHLKSTGIEHAAPCTDAVFLRRVFLYLRQRADRVDEDPAEIGRAHV